MNLRTPSRRRVGERRNKGGQQKIPYPGEGEAARATVGAPLASHAQGGVGGKRPKPSSGLAAHAKAAGRGAGTQKSKETYNMQQSPRKPQNQSKKRGGGARPTHPSPHVRKQQGAMKSSKEYGSGKGREQKHRHPQPIPHRRKQSRQSSNTRALATWRPEAHPYHTAVGKGGQQATPRTRARSLEGRGHGHGLHALEVLDIVVAAALVDEEILEPVLQCLKGWPLVRVLKAEQRESATSVAHSSMARQHAPLSKCPA